MVSRSCLAITTKTKVSTESVTDIPKELAMSETFDVKKNTGIRVRWWRRVYRKTCDGVRYLTFKLCLSQPRLERAGISG